MLRLGNEDAVKRVPVVMWKGPEQQNMFRAKRQQVQMEFRE